MTLGSSLNHHGKLQEASLSIAQVSLCTSGNSVFASLSVRLNNDALPLTFNPSTKAQLHSLGLAYV